MVVWISPSFASISFMAGQLGPCSSASSLLSWASSAYLDLRFWMRGLSRSGVTGMDSGSFVEMDSIWLFLALSSMRFFLMSERPSEIFAMSLDR